MDEALYDDVRETNNVAHGSLSRPINTRRITLENPSATFNKNKLGGCGFNLVHPDLAALSIHRSGRFSVMGTKSSAQTALAIAKFKYIMQSYEANIRLAPSGYTINNVVCCGHVAPINLTLMQNTWPHAVRYDPVNFRSAATISCKDLGISNTNVYVFAFESGKCNIIGGKSRAEGERSFAEVKRIVLDHVRIRDSMVTDASKPVDLGPKSGLTGLGDPNLVTEIIDDIDEEEYMASMISKMKNIVETQKQ